MKAPHHAVVKKAAREGFVLEADHEHGFFVIRWPERNKEAFGNNEKQILDDMQALRMATLEYPKFKIWQDGVGVWKVAKGRKVLAEGGELRPTLYEAIDIDEHGEDGVDPEMDEDFEGEDLEDGPVEGEPEEGGSRSVVKAKYRKIYKEKPIKNTCSDDLVAQLRDYLEVEIVDDDGEFLRMGIDTEKLRRFAEANGIWNERYADLNPGMQRMNIGNRLRAKTKKDPDYEIKWVR